MKNKCGNIPITILIIGIVAICGIVIFSFYVSENRTVLFIFLVRFSALLRLLKQEVQNGEEKSSFAGVVCVWLVVWFVCPRIAMG